MNVASSNLVPLAPVRYTAWSETAPLRLTALFDGLPYSVTSATWSENSHVATDTATIAVPLSSNPDFPQQLFRGIVTNPIQPTPAAQEQAAANLQVFVELYVGFPQNVGPGTTPISQLQRRFLGQVDIYSGTFH